jgi:hypothetical protein
VTVFIDPYSFNKISSFRNAQNPLARVPPSTKKLWIEFRRDFTRKGVFAVSVISSEKNY